MSQTLYKILQQQRIEIPIIQRDYAQGRENKVYLRERLLGKMINALQGKESLNLDFVYGTNEHGAMWPLDGQQRLTTLWLLHWYLAVRTNSLASAKEWLSKFTYETRTTSRDFCKSLCNMNAEAFNQSDMKIVDFIKDQTWFYSKYNQDPTIQGMLRTLGGTNIKNSENVDIQDGIEEFLYNDNNCSKYWELLLDDNCPIHFLFMDMKDENLPLSDDLYIKMNARGKQLTDFENFKADLIGYAPNEDKPDKKLFDNDSASLIDNKWTDVFWNVARTKEVFKVDDIYFRFLRRYFLDRLIATTSHNVQKILQMELYKDLYDDNKNYDGLRGYNEVLTKNTIESLKNLFARWNEVEIAPYWKETDKFAFIPEYIKEKETVKDDKPTVVEVSTISQKQRAVFHAVCCYFENNSEFNEKLFEQWMRFVWNIVENSNLNNEEAMIGAIRLFEELRSKSNNILSFLASDETIKSNFATKQIEEERFKAKLLCGEQKKEWSQLIRDAETMLFFKGNIACLLRDKKEFVENIDWFKTKLKNAKEYFGDSEIKEEFALALTKALIRIIQRWDQLVEQYIYDTNAEAWKENILNNSIFYEEVHSLLIAPDLDKLTFIKIKKEEGKWVDSANAIKEKFGVKNFLEQEPYSPYGKIVSKGSEWRIHKIGGVLAFFPYRKNYAYCFDWIDTDSSFRFRRNSLLYDLENTKKIEVEDNKSNEGVYWNWWVSFKYKNNSFTWGYDNIINLLNQKNESKERDANHTNESNDKYFCIDMNKQHVEKGEELLDLLEKLVEEASNN